MDYPRLAGWSTLWRALALVALAMGLLATLGAAQPSAAGPATHIVVFHQEVDPDAAAADLARQHGLGHEFVYRNALRGASFTIPPGKVAAVASDPRVAFVERNQQVAAFGQTIPTGVDRIDSEAVGGPVDVDIAILDTGIDLDHPDLNVVASTNCARGGARGGGCKDGEGDDGNGHGTHVAGIAAARNNTVGVVGVAPGARLWAVRVLGNDGSGWMSWIIAGVDWVTAHADQVEVANMSLGCECQSAALDSAIANSVAAGVTYVVAAGNSAKDASTFSPANHPDVVTVSAIVDTDGRCGGLGPSTSYGADDTFASFSNFGPLVEVAAPGVNITSTYKGGTYATMSGTSMASPHVAGAAAVYLAANPGASPADVRSALIARGVSQDTACDTSLADGKGGFTGDPDSSAEPLVYVAAVATPDTTPPGAPTGLTATAGDRSVALDWADSSESDLAGYQVYRSTTSGGPYTQVNATLVTSSAYADTGLSAGTTYYYVVTAVDAAGNESGASSEASATPYDDPPAAPTGLTASAGDSQVALDWADNPESDVAGYHVYRSTTSGGPYTQVNATLVTSSAYTDTGLTNGTTYYYVVTAVDVAGHESSASSETAATPSSAPTMSVAEVRYSTQGGRNNSLHLLVTVTVVDDGGHPVANAAVTIKLYRNGSLYASGSGSTGSNGQVTFKQANAPSGCYTEELAVSHLDYQWDGVIPDSQPTDPFCK